MLHGFGKNKIAAIPAIKAVIENGDIILFTESYKNIYDRYIIAAKGNIDGKPAVIAAVVNRYKNNNKNKFYLHEAEIIEANPSSMTGSPNGVDTVNEFASVDSISNPNENVKEYKIFPP